LEIEKLEWNEKGGFLDEFPTTKFYPPIASSHLGFAIVA
jgi:hypothetical protein